MENVTYDGHGIKDADGMYIQVKREHRERFLLTPEQEKEAKRLAIGEVHKRMRAGVRLDKSKKVEDGNKKDTSASKRKIANARYYQSGNLTEVDEDYFREKVLERLLKATDAGFKNLESSVLQCNDFQKLASGLTILAELTDKVRGGRDKKRKDAVNKALEVGGQLRDRTAVLAIASNAPSSVDIARSISDARERE